MVTQPSGTAPDASQTDTGADASQALDTGTETDNAAESSEEGSEDKNPEDLVDNMDWESLEKVLSADPKKLKKPKAATEDEEEEDDEAETEEKGGEETDDEAKARIEEETAEDKRELAKNYRLHTTDPKRQKLLTLMRKNPDASLEELAKLAGISVAAATKIEEGKETEETKEQAQAQSAQVTEALKPQREALAVLEAEMAALEKQIQEAEEGYMPTGVLNAKLLRKSGEVDAAKRALEKAETDHAEAAEWQADYDAKNLVARKAAIERHPEAGKKGTIQFKLIRAELEDAEAANPRFVDDPRYPQILLDRLEISHPTFFPKKAKGGKPAVKETVPTREPKPTRVLGEPIGAHVAGNRGTTATLEGKELETQIDNLSEEELEKLADSVGTKKAPKRKY